MPNEACSTQPLGGEGPAAPAPKQRGGGATRAARWLPAAHTQSQRRIVWATVLVSHLRLVQALPCLCKTGALCTSCNNDPELDQTVSQRIEDDSRNIAVIAQRLVDAQDNIRQTEQEVLNKVFDISSVKAFALKHQASLEEHRHLSQEVAELLQEVQSLRANLSAVREAGQKQGVLYGVDEHKLQEAASEEEKRLQDYPGLDSTGAPLEPCSPPIPTISEVGASEVGALPPMPMVAAAPSPHMPGPHMPEIYLPPPPRIPGMENIPLAVPVPGLEVSPHMPGMEGAPSHYTPGLENGASASVPGGLEVSPQTPGMEGAVSPNMPGGEDGGSSAVVPEDSIPMPEIPVSVPESIPPIPLENPVIASTIAQEEAVAAENEELSRGNDLLRKQNANALKTVDTVTRALASARNSLAAKQRESAGFEGAIVQQKHYEEQCKRGQEVMTRQIQALQAQRAEAQRRLRDSQQNNTQVYQLNLLRSNNDQLKVRLSKARANEATFQAQVVVLTEQIAAVQIQGAAHLRGMQGELDILTAKALTLESELTGVMAERKAIEHEIRRWAAELHSLEAELARGVLVALKANSTLLQDELARAHQELQSSQSSMAEAHAMAGKSKQALLILRQQVDRNAFLAQKVARESLVKVVAARAIDDPDVAAAEESSMQAESARPEDCDVLWDRDKDHAEILKELSTCPPVKQDLQTANAQVASLTSMLAATS